MASILQKINLQFLLCRLNRFGPSQARISHDCHSRWLQLNQFGGAKRFRDITIPAEVADQLLPVRRWFYRTEVTPLELIRVVCSAKVHLDRANPLKSKTHWFDCPFHHEVAPSRNWFVHVTPARANHLWGSSPGVFSDRGFCSYLSCMAFSVGSAWELA